MLKQVARFLFKEFLEKLKMKIFLVFIGVAIVLWSLTKLSMNYIGLVYAKVEYDQLAGDKLLLNSEEPKVPLLVSTNGYRMLGYLFSSPTIRVNASRAQQLKGVNHFITTSGQFSSVAQQLPSDVKLEQLATDSLFLDLGVNKTKRIPVVAQLQVEFKKGFSFYDNLKLEPDSITVSGAENLIDSIQQLMTSIKELQDISQSFEESITLEIPDKFQSLSFSDSEVKVSGEVDRFTEESIVVPITLVGVDPGKTVKLFPDEATIRYKIAFKDLNSINVSQFKVECDFSSLNSDNEVLIARLVEFPEKTHSARILTSNIDYLIKQ